MCNKNKGENIMAQLTIPNNNVVVIKGKNVEKFLKINHKDRVKHAIEISKKFDYIITDKTR